MLLFIARVALTFGLLLLIPATGSAQTDPCADLAGIDFGPCDAVLGWGVIGGECQEISGCSSPVPLSASRAECEAACNPEPNCDDLAGTNFGICLAVLGAGVIAGECKLISGCSSPVALFVTVAACIAACESVPADPYRWSSLKARYQAPGRE